MIALLLLACHVNEDHDCVRTSREVGYDEVLGDIGLTADELTAGFGGAHTFDVVDPGGAATSVTFTVARGEGPVVLHDAEWVLTRELKPGLFEHDTMMGIFCDDTAELPFDVTAAVPSAEVRVSGGAAGQVTEGVTALRGTLDAAGTITPGDAGDGDGGLFTTFEDDTLVAFQLTLDDDRSWHRPQDR